ncbi:kinase phosphorylation protein-domain-containing protein [Pisolithus marmoratus]|nr:kinase phosphorylation protein-domain-containing protein [Pisolithus marmoratus]
MFEPVRGGTRGGQAQFKWTDVAADKDREHYLGHSINAPTGRWQKNKDIHWYNRGESQTKAERDEEIRKVKEAEAEALAVALGFAPSSNSQPLASSVSAPNLIADGEAKREEEERKRRKAERKELRRARKEARKAAHGQDRPRDGTRSPSRSSPHRKRDTEDRYTRRSRSRSPKGRAKGADRVRDYGSIERRHDRPSKKPRDLGETQHRSGARYRDD